MKTVGVKGGENACECINDEIQFLCYFLGETLSRKICTLQVSPIYVHKKMSSEKCNNSHTAFFTRKTQGKKNESYQESCVSKKKMRKNLPSAVEFQKHETNSFFVGTS